MQDKCKFKETSRFGLYVMVFLIFLNVFCNIAHKGDIGKLEKKIENLEMKINELLER